MKCCDNCGKYLNDNADKFAIGIEYGEDNGVNNILDERIMLCDTCLKSLQTEIKTTISVHRRFLNCKIEESEKME